MMAESTVKLAGDSAQPTGNSDIYKYSPLTNPEDIRLMELLPGDKSASLVCRLSVLALSDAPQYEALSYTWGDLSDRQNLYLKSEDSESINTSTALLKITRSLHEALMQLRDPAESRTIWVDAVCIDQENLPERGHQVGIMRRIYHHAIRVLIWLGPEDEETFEAVNMITELKDRVKGPDDEPVFSFEHPRLLDENGVFSDWSGLENLVTTSGRHYDQKSPAAVALLNLYYRPWFRRIWVVQEATAGGSNNLVHIGSFVVPWNDLGRATAWLAVSFGSRFEVTDIRESGQRNVLTMWLGTLLADKTPPPILYNTRRFLATDSRDKIHALFGFPAFQRLSQEFNFRPDYTIPLQKVYEKVAVWSMKSSQTLETLHYVDHPILSDDSLTWPSWIPRWDRPSSSTCLPLQANALYNRNSYGTLSLTEDHRGGILELKGVSMGCVSDVAQYIDWLSDDHRADVANAAALTQFWDRILQQSRDEFPLIQTRSNSDIFTSLGQALTAGLGTDDGPTAKMSAFHTADAIDYLLDYFDSASCSYRFRTSSLHNYLLSIEPQIRDESRFNFGDTVAWACTNRRLFYTHDGRFGLGPMVIQPDDIIAVLYGGYTPFVLRPSGDYFLLVGECYVNGLMDGEAFELFRQKSKTGRLQEREFRLK